MTKWGLSTDPEAVIASMAQYSAILPGTQLNLFCFFLKQKVIPRNQFSSLSLSQSFSKSFEIIFIYVSQHLIFLFFFFFFWSLKDSSIPVFISLHHLQSKMKLCYLLLLF